MDEPSPGRPWVRIIKHDGMLVPANQGGKTELLEAMLAAREKMPLTLPPFEYVKPVLEKPLSFDEALKASLAKSRERRDRKV